MSVRILRFLLLAVAASSLLLLTHSLWMSALGQYLIETGAPVKADFVVVLAGDSHGNRILKAASLVKEGYAKKAIVSGPPCCYGSIESELAVNYAVRNGYPAEYFVQAPSAAQSTRDEARLLTGEVRRQGGRSFLLVTSDYHTRRAARLFRRELGGLEMRVVAAPDRHFRYDSWWRDREATRLFYMEWSKHVAEFLGL